MDQNLNNTNEQTNELIKAFEYYFNEQKASNNNAFKTIIEMIDSMQNEIGDLRREIVRLNENKNNLNF